MGQRETVFRQAALNRLSSPEQLDQLMEVTSLRGWTVLAALGLLLSSVVAWGFAGRIPTTVAGQGILIQRGGLVEIEATGNGQVASLAVDVGDVVKSGDVIAQIAQPDLVSKIQAARAHVAELERVHQHLLDFGAQNLQLQSQQLLQERQITHDSIQQTKQRIASLQERLISQNKLLADGLLTKQVVEQTEQEISTAKETIARFGNRLQQLSVSELQVERQKEQEILASEHRINDAKRTLQSLEQEHERHSIVRSPEDGRIIEVRARKGDLVYPGIPIVNVEPLSDDRRDLELVMYLPASVGKQVKPGMRVQISPSTVASEEYGFMLGTVEDVAKYPATRQGMMRVLANEHLVDAFQRACDSTPIAVRARLTEDTSTPSGYRWSSRRGPPDPVHAGTLSSANITVQEQRPVTLVLPAFKDALGL